MKLASMARGYANLRNQIRPSKQQMATSKIGSGAQFCAAKILNGACRTWVNSDTFTVSARCPLSPRSLPNRWVAATNEKGHERHFRRNWPSSALPLTATRYDVAASH